MKYDKKTFGADTYFGELLNGNRNGYGVNLFAAGHIYRGEWKENKRNGKGTFISSDGG